MVKRSIIFLFTLLVVLGITAAGITLFSKPVPEPVIYTGSLSMDHQKAYDNISELCESFPRRSIFRDDNRLAAEWLKVRLNELDLEVGTLEFDSWAGETKVEGLENVYGISRGSTHPDEIIIVTSHYDIPDFVYQGAADAGSDVGIILELARVFSSEEHARSMMFLFANNEEYGMGGAYNFARNYEDINNVVAVLVMDYMNMGEYDYTLVRFEGMATGYTPLWLRELAVASAARVGEAQHVDPFMEWVQRAVTIASTDTGMFLSAGIPAVNITSRAKDLEWQRRIYHTEEDTMDYIKPETVKIYGQTAELILRSIDTMPEIPQETMLYFKSDGKYMPGWLITALQLLIFVPFFTLLAVELKKEPGLDLMTAIRGDGVRVLFLFLSGFAGYLVLKFLPTTALMVRYELYPATQKDPILYNPQIVPVAIFIVTILVVGLILFKLVVPRLQRPAVAGSADLVKADFVSSRWLLLGLLALLVIIIWVEGSGFAGTIFLLLPAYLWLWVKPPSSAGKKITNLLLVIAGSAVFLSFIYIFATTYQVGVIWWYMLLGAAFGLFSIKVVAVFIMAVALFIAMLSLAVRSEK